MKTSTPPLRRELLDQILSQPTAPFREGHVIQAVLEALGKARVPHFQDPVGNIVLGAADSREYRRILSRRGVEPLRLFVAHMDHPGFHGVAWTNARELEIKWHGGSPLEHLEGATLWLADRSGWKQPGTLRGAKLLASGRALESGTLVLSDQGRPQLEELPATSLFGGFGFRAPWWQEGELIHTKAADDLVGCFAIVSVALDLFTKRRGAGDLPFLGLLTRAEEVGAIGAIEHLELGWMEGARRPVICVSLEASRTLPGAEIGKGPVARLGDRFTVFDPGMLRVMIDVAEKRLTGAHQRRIMDGGTCEATTATAFGLKAIGISVPLGNYHNQSFEGGPDSRGPNGPAPEFVHLGDVQGLVTLCHSLLAPKLPWEKPWAGKLKQLRKLSREYRSLMRTAP